MERPRKYLGTIQLKENIIQGWLLYVIRSFPQVVFRFQYQLINLVWLSIDLFLFSWSQSYPQSNFKKLKTSFLSFSYNKKVRWGQDWAESPLSTICFLVALYSLVCSYKKKQENLFFFFKKKKRFLVLILQWTCFICLSWKRKQTMEQQPHRTCEWTKPNKSKKRVTSHSNWPRILLFDLTHKQCNGIIKTWLHCLTSKSKWRFLANNILLAWCVVMAQTQFSLTRK